MPAAGSTAAGAAVGAAVLGGPAEAGGVGVRAAEAGDGVSVRNLPKFPLVGDREEVYHVIREVSSNSEETTLWLHNPYKVTRRLWVAL
jgi:hypothetical protein